MNPRYLKIPLLLLALTPLVFYEGALFPFIFSKTLYIRTLLTLVWVGLAAFLLYQLYQRYLIRVNQKTISVNQRSAISENPRLSNISVNQRLWKNPIFLSVTAFFVIIAVGTILAENPYRAFWGDVERGEGLVGLLFFFGFFAAVSLLFKAIDWKRFFILTLVPAVMLFADQLLILFARQSFFIQIHEIDFAAGRALGSLVGNPTFLSTFYLFAIFAAAMLLASRRRIAGRDTPLAARSNNIPTFLRPVVSFALLLGSRMSEYLSFESVIRIGLIIVIALSIAGIFIGQTRGAILGLLLGIIVAALFIAFRKDFPQAIRRIAIIGILAVFVFAAIFIATRASPLWQEIPGIARIAAITWEDPTLQTRLISAGIGINAINPANEGIIRTLFGWGQENFSVAYQEHFEPRFFRYEHTWFDRAHNKLIDVLVMNGALGLIAYLAIWFFVFRFIFKRNTDPYGLERIHTDISINPRHQQNPYISASILFFATAYFVQNLFAFENVSTYIPFFAFLAFVAFSSTRIYTDNKDTDSYGLNNTQIDTDNESVLIRNHPHQSASDKISTNPRSHQNWLLPVFAVIVAIFYIFILVTTFIAFGQMRAYLAPLAAGRSDMTIVNFNKGKITEPYTYIQPELRSGFLQMALANIRPADMDSARPFLTRLTEKMRDAAYREHTSARHFMITAEAYQALGEEERARDYRRRALELAPRRQDVLYAVALSEAALGNKDLALNYARRIVELDAGVPISRAYYAMLLAVTRKSAAFEEATGIALAVYDREPLSPTLANEIAIARQIFYFYLVEFYQARESERFLQALQKFRLFEERGGFEERAAAIQDQIDAFLFEGWQAVRAE